MQKTDPASSVAVEPRSKQRGRASSALPCAGGSGGGTTVTVSGAKAAAEPAPAAALCARGGSSTLCSPPQATLSEHAGCHCSGPLCSTLKCSTAPATGAEAQP
eukprot:7263-Heterococcus_DN1.PRE.1